MKFFCMRGEKQRIPWEDHDVVAPIALGSLSSPKLPSDVEKSGAVLKSFICIKKNNSIINKSIKNYDMYRF